MFVHITLDIQDEQVPRLLAEEQELATMRRLFPCAVAITATVASQVIDAQIAKMG